MHNTVVNILSSSLLYVFFFFLLHVIADDGLLPFFPEPVFLGRTA